MQQALEYAEILDISRKDEIETAFGGALSWQRLDTKRACRIACTIERGGYRSPAAEWPAIHREMVETMATLEAALTPRITSLRQ